MRSRLRKVLFWTHLAAGLVAALPILVMCITGVLMMYQRQTQSLIDRWGMKSYPPASGAQALNVEDLIRKIQQTQGIKPEAITVFPGATQPVAVYLNRQLGSFYLDAYSGAVIGKPSQKTQQFFRKVMAWHGWLGVSGPHRAQFRAMVEAVNMVVLLLAILGTYLWIPRRWTWPHLRGTVLPRSGMTGRARDFNWHNAIGIWSAVPILVIAWTGIAMSYGWANRLTYRAVGNTNVEWRRGDETASLIDLHEKMRLEYLLSRAKRQSAQWKAITMEVPHDDSDAVDFAIDTSGYDGIGKSSALELDRTGKVVVFTPAGSGGIPAPTFIRYGHTGEAWGVVGQTIAGAASLGGTVLVWTGVALSFRRFRSYLARKTKTVRQDA